MGKKITTPTIPDKVDKVKHSSVKPQQQAFLSYYLDPKSDTFGNAYRSGLRAGYPEGYSKMILYNKPAWLMDNLTRMNMLVKAERNLDRALDIDVMDEVIGDRALKATFFVAEKLGKEIYGRNEEEGGNVTKILILPQTLILKNGITNAVNLNSSTRTDSERPTQISSSENGKEGGEDRVSDIGNGSESSS
jgi:hypothetical protein